MKELDKDDWRDRHYLKWKGAQASASICSPSFFVLPIEHSQGCLVCVVVLISWWFRYLTSLETRY